MGLLRLAWKNILGNAFRSLAIFLCAALMAGLALTATFVVRGAEASLRSNLQRLGADILVLPWGTMTEKIEGIRLMSAAIDGWMPRAYMQKVAALEGVAEVSPQLYLATLDDSPYSPYPKMYLVAFDPQTDFALLPWLETDLGAGLAEGEAIAGAHIALPGGIDELVLYGTPIKLSGRLALTKTTIDNTLFVSFDTAKRMMAWSETQSQPPLNIMADTISAMMVKVKLDSDPHEVAVQILEQVNGVVPLETPNLFQEERRQMVGVLRTMLGSLGAVWILMLVFLGLVFSIAANERRFEIGVLRALGFPAPMILKTLLFEGATLAIGGSLSGVIVTILGFVLFGDQVVSFTRLPLSVPSPLGLVTLSLVGQVLAFASVTLAAFVPAWRISHEEVAVTMRD